MSTFFWEQPGLDIRISIDQAATWADLRSYLSETIAKHGSLLTDLLHSSYN